MVEQVQLDWKQVIRKGLFPSLGTAILKQYRKALVERDPRLIQRQTVHPNHLPATCEKACLIAFGGFLHNLTTVNEITNYFVDIICIIRKRLGYEAGEIIVQWWDSTDRTEAERELINMIDEELERRAEITLQVEESLRRIN